MKIVNVPDFKLITFTPLAFREGPFIKRFALFSDCNDDPELQSFWKLLVSKQ